MLNFFHSIFKGFEQTGGYPNDLVEAAIERAVDGTDPSLRAVSGYRRKLRPAVLTAIDHVVTLADGLSPPRLATRESYSHDPLLQAMFLSAHQMQKILQDLLSAHIVGNGVVYALLVMDMQQRGVFGAELQGNTVVRDVPQVTVSFANHRLVDPSDDEGETLHLLKRRAFDHLLKMALKRMLATKDLREELDNRLILLKAKHDALLRGRWGFEHDMPQGSSTDLSLIHI